MSIAARRLRIWCADADHKILLIYDKQMEYYSPPNDTIITQINDMHKLDIAGLLLTTVSEFIFICIGYTWVESIAIAY